MLLLQHRDLGGRFVAHDALGDGQPDDAAAHDHHAAPGCSHLEWCSAMMRAYSRPESFTVRTCVS